MNSITSSPIFQIAATVILTLLGTVIFYYKKQKKDIDRPEIRYVIKGPPRPNTTHGFRLYIERVDMKSIRNINLSSINKKNSKIHNPWRYSLETPLSDQKEIGFNIPDHLCNVGSFSVKVEYNHREHKYTDKIIINPQKKTCTVH